MKRYDFRWVSTLVMLCAALMGGGWPVAASAADAASETIEPAGPKPEGLTTDNPFAAVGAGPSQAQPGDHVVFRYTVYLLNKDHYLYKERMSLAMPEIDGISWGQPRFSPKPDKKYDTFEEREMEIYHVPATLWVDGRVSPDAKPGPRTIEATLKYQGCNPAVCFFPQTKKVELKLDIVAAKASGHSRADSATTTLMAGAAEGTGPGGTGAGGDENAAKTSRTSSPNPGRGAARAGGRPFASGASAADAGARLAASGSVAEGAMGSGSGGFWEMLSAGNISGALSKSFLLTFLGVFLLGILASLTPCIYPIIPITISVLGAKEARSRLHGFSLALVYVLGISLTYTALGMFAATTGALFGTWLQSPVVTGAIALLFILMGFGMLGVFQVSVPAGMAARLSSIQGRGYAGAFLTGSVAGLVASPCVGPIIVALLTWIAQTRDIAMGAALMFTFSFGMGQLFLLLGTFAVSLPRSGAWMDSIKGFLALLLFGVGLYYLHTVVPDGYYELLVGVAALTAAAFVGAFLPLADDASTGLRLRKVGGLLLMIVGVYSIVGGLLTTRIVAPSVTALIQGAGGDRVAARDAASIQWVRDFDEGLALAARTNRPILLDFTADWCSACQELEHNTYSDPRVIDAAQAYVPIMLDVTRSTPETDALQARFGIKGLPSVLFLSSDGEPHHDLTVTGFVPPEEFLSRMCMVAGSDTAQASRLVDVCRG